MSEDLLVPPLPPGCEEWLRIDEHGILLAKLEQDGCAWTCASDPTLRPWVVARCRCAWKDEAERLGRSGQPWQQNVAALAAAEAWKAWGRGKE